ncbi:hypothetical protein DSL72_003390 [Monilinia vaccinii-corymbosi]|uniref:ribonuclease H n=1 Tax=Monilinia vaccinii-corymbosi TaxID=61207 RepID=A0A8A3NT56_9HELO|nr:hypothetical protein DSL72_003390 [Monilinia vaccinii-corymbosi]
MTYLMKIYVDGGCRNGRHGAYGAAAAVFKDTYDNTLTTWTQELHSFESPAPTNQRAEITAIILAQSEALGEYDSLIGFHGLHIKIYSDSRYAVNCMNEWIYRWRENGWQNARGARVVNRDLIEEADDLDTELKHRGRVEYIWIPRDANQDADQACNKCMDDM